MSLINEALRKARREAAEAQRSPSGHPAPQQRADRGAPWAALLLIALFAALLGGGVSWWLLRGRAEQPAPANETRVEIKTHLKTTPEVPPIRGNHPLRIIDRTAVTPTPAGIAPTKTGNKAAETQEVSSTPNPTPTLPLPTPTPEPEKTVFTATATIDGVVLNLDYLVFRKDQPFAEINGVTVGEGGIVQGFRIEKILNDRILLTRNGKKYTILVSS